MESIKGEITNNVPIKNSFPCELCGYIFSENGNLKRHIKFVHLNPHIEKRFPCDICHIQFRHEKGFLRHQQKGHKYKCDQCQKEYNSNEGLSAHKENIQGNKRE